ncbi:phage tail tape measure protein [Pseudomonas aeruginosa]|uniref:phage tail tape measure protein n=1 Tax=Pseudomonas aeruginosa TaxID=287 RepID=UPI000F5205FA|nr:phage tail tape measure protein [Pseudomonas aeruginosa]ELP1305181.1 phage tail tape measure protein [Pseudomonas aeruginosa]RQF90440.1 phage tail tape measure protein [Pseudomonas aeruginosa]HEP8761424.1 phage tail tape measure protein [Pseudomonas aeruginosa]
MDIASLGIAVHSESADQAAQDLDRLVGSAVRAENAVDSVGETSAQASARISNMVRASLEASDYHQRLAKAATSSSAALEKANASTIDWTKYQEEINARGQAIIQSQQRIAEQAKKSATAAQEQSTSLDAGSRNLARFNDQLGRTGLTARQTQAAMRGLPAQISDVVVSIQGGQSPMQVLLQQGAQVRDMFGGLGPALRAVGGYALSLINPVNGLAAAAGTLGFAFYDAEKKAAAFSKAIFAGNGAAGMTGSALAQVAKQAASVSGSLASANRAAIALAASGKVGAGQLQSLTETTSAIAQFTGRDIEDVAKSLSELGDDATRAAARVSEQYRLLSYEQYQAIKAIDEQGDHQQAVDQLNEDLHRNAQERLKQYRESLSGVEQGWDAVKTAIGNAYAAIRADLFPTLNEQIQTLQRTLDQRQNAPFLSNALRGALTGAATGLPGVAATGALFQSFRDQFSSTEALKEQNSLLLVRKDLSEQNAKSEAELGEADQQLIAIEKELGDQLGDVSPAAKRAKAIDELTKRYVAGYRAAEKMISAGKLSALPDWLKGVNIVGDSVSGGTFDKLVAGINQRFKDPKAARSSQFRDDAATQYLLRLREQQGALEQQLGTSEKLSVSQREMAKWEQQIADLKVKAVLTADQKSLLAREAEVRAQLQKNVALEAEARKKEEIARIDAYRANLEGRLRSVQQGYELQIAGLGAGDEERRRIQDRLKLEQDYQSQSAKLQEQRNRGETNGGISQSQYEKELAALDDYHRKALAKQNDYFHQVDETQKDWSLGARSAFKTYLESARDVAGQTKNLFTSVFSSMEDAVAAFATTGKLSFSDFAKSILADMARIATRAAASQALSSLFGGFFGGGNAAAQSGVDNLVSNSGLFANGGAFAGGVQMFATGGAFTNSVVSTPTAFGMSGGRMGVMGEAGPEAVMPLTRTSSGALGVRAMGGSSSQINVEVNIASDGSANVSSSQPGLDQFGRDIGTFVEQKYRQLLARDLRRDGAIGRAING